MELPESLQSANAAWLAASKEVDTHLDVCNICGPILENKTCEVGEKLLQAYEAALDVRNEEVRKLHKL